MYAVAGTYLGQVDRLPVVAMIGRVELSVAFAAWALVFVAMIRHVWHTVLASPARQDGASLHDVVR